MVLEERLKQTLFQKDYLTLEELVDTFRDNLLLNTNDGKANCCYLTKSNSFCSNITLKILLQTERSKLKAH